MTTVVRQLTSRVGKRRLSLVKSERTRTPAGARWISDSLLVITVLCLWTLLQVFYLGGLSESRAQDNLYKEFRGQLAAATAPTGGLIEPRDPVALIKIPALGIDDVVVEGTTSGDLRSGPGHARNSVLPGQPGTAVVLGRAQMYGGPFKHVASLKKGDKITTVTAQGEATYVVSGVRRAGDDFTPPAAGKGKLTLVTAEGKGSWAGVTPSEVVSVDADLTSTAYGAPASPAVILPKAEKPMGVNPDGLPLVTLGLAALVLVGALIVFARTLLSPVLTWVIGGPILLAVAWAATDWAVELLPNLV